MKGHCVFRLLLGSWLSLLGPHSWAQEAPLRPPVAGLNRWEALVRDKTGARWVERGAQLVQESGGNPRARSQAGAQGLMQAMPLTWVWYQDLGWVPCSAMPFDPEWAVEGGHRHMLYLEGLFQGDERQSLAAFNAGQKRVLQARALARSLGLPGEDGWLRALPRVMKPGAAKEPLAYVTRIPRLAREIRRQRRLP